MPRPALRSRSLRRVFRKAPSGRTVIHYERRRNSRAKCAICKGELNGIKTNELNRFSKSEKRPERKYGGYLCHKCLERVVKLNVRGLV